MPVALAATGEAAYTTAMDIEGVSPSELKALSRDDQDALLAFGRPITFNIGTADVLAEFNRRDDTLSVNLAHIEGGGEGVLATLWKLVESYAGDRGYAAIEWNVHALTCANPNPRLQRFLRSNGFAEIDHPVYGRILERRQLLACRQP